MIRVFRLPHIVPAVITKSVWCHDGCPFSPFPQYDVARGFSAKDGNNGQGVGG